MRNIHRLTPTAVKNAKPGKRSDGTPRAKIYPDGGGLYLQVTPGESRVSRSWIFRYATLQRKERYMGLGSLETVTLADARLKAADCRKLIEQGKDPIETREAQRAASAAQAVQTVTFDECVRS